MQTLFSPDSKFMQALSRGADLMLLNLLFLLTCIPVVTIGPSAAALYRVIFAMGTAREDGIIRPYFRAFRENFLSALKAWLILLGVAAALSLDLLLAIRLGGIFIWFSLVFAILLAMELLAAAMLFPLLSLFQNSTLGTLKNALVLGLGQLPRAAAIAALWVFPLVVLWCMPLTFFYAAFIWIVIYFSGAAFLASLLLKPVFAPYLPNEEDLT